MLQLDLKQTWDWQKNISWNAFEVTPNPKTGASVRQAMVAGALFHGPYNTPQVWTYGGTIFRGNETFLDAVNPAAFHDQSNIYPLWSFNNETNTWNQFDIGTLNTPSYGSSTEAPDQGLAFYLHGRTDNGTNIGAKDAGDVQILLDGMVVIDLVHHTSKNISTAGMKDSQPRLGGGLQYVPNIGNNGLLVALGGKVLDGVQPVTSESMGRLLDFDTVDVFDLASYSDTKSNGTWYTQSTSGEIPSARIDSCTVLASAPDNSSHNIFMYGGWDPTATSNTTKYFDDMYALSLPSFTWIKMFEGESPRYGHTCHLTAGRQLLTVGGSTQHGNITDTCDWETESIAVMDLPTMTWGSIFTAGHQPYELSNGLIKMLGGTAQGNATLKEPVLGWASAEFENVMRTSRVYSNLEGTLGISRPVATKPSGSFRARITIITTVTITGSCVIACIVLLWLRRRRRNNTLATDRAEDPVEPSYEVEEKAKFELPPDEKQVYELTGEGYMHEATDGAIRVEADRSNIAVGVAELPATNFGEKGRWGVPLIKVPSPTFIDDLIASKKDDVAKTQ